MKKKEKTSLVTASTIELEKQLAETAKKLASLRLERYTKQMKNTREARTLRKDIAIIKTVIRQKEQAV